VKSERSDFTGHFPVSSRCLFKVSVQEMHVYVSQHVDEALGGRESALCSIGRFPSAKRASRRDRPPVDPAEEAV
jgi:hypothetical protein